MSSENGLFTVDGERKDTDDGWTWKSVVMRPVFCKTAKRIWPFKPNVSYTLHAELAVDVLMMRKVTLSLKPWYMHYLQTTAKRLNCELLGFVVRLRGHYSEIHAVSELCGPLSVDRGVLGQWNLYPASCPWSIDINVDATLLKPYTFSPALYTPESDDLSADVWRRAAEASKRGDVEEAERLIVEAETLDMKSAEILWSKAREESLRMKAQVTEAIALSIVKRNQRKRDEDDAQWQTRMNEIQARINELYKSKGLPEPYPSEEKLC